jgi:hypothetical protein
MCRGRRERILLHLHIQREKIVLRGSRAEDTGSALEFWTAVKNQAVYDSVDENLRLKSAKKTLNALGYDMTHTHECWPEALSWGWDCVRAIINCYWLNTTVSLDWKVKKMLKIVNKHYKELARCITPLLDATVDFPERSLEQTLPFVSSLFVFKVDKQKQIRVEINIDRHFQLISEMSENDLKTLGHSIGFSPTLYNPKSAKYQSAFATTAAGSGNGYTNNRIFSSASDNQTTAGAANAAVGNAANQYKIGRYVDITNTAGQGIYGTTNTLMTPNQLNSEFRPYYKW